MIVLKMAWRNIWRNRRRTLVTVGAMTLALTVLILYTSLVEGYLRDLERNILELELGDVQVYTQSYIDKPSGVRYGYAGEAQPGGAGTKQGSERYRRISVDYR